METYYSYLVYLYRIAIFKLVSFKLLPALKVIFQWFLKPAKSNRVWADRQKFKKNDDGSATWMFFHP